MKTITINGRAWARHLYHKNEGTHFETTERPRSIIERIPIGTTHVLIDGKTHSVEKENPIFDLLFDIMQELWFAHYPEDRA